jgi:hypothetical protein
LWDSKTYKLFFCYKRLSSSIINLKDTPGMDAQNFFNIGFKISRYYKNLTGGLKCLLSLSVQNATIDLSIIKKGGKSHPALVAVIQS